MQRWTESGRGFARNDSRGFDEGRTFGKMVSLNLILLMDGTQIHVRLYVLGDLLPADSVGDLAIASRQSPVMSKETDA